METVQLTATQIIHGLTGAKRCERIADRGIPAHPALAVLEWENTRTDVHGVACSTMARYTDDGPTLYHFNCHCGFETAKRQEKDDATAELIQHAMTTCAVCQGPKPSDNFPRCSGCAF